MKTETLQKMTKLLNEELQVVSGKQKDLLESYRKNIIVGNFNFHEIRRKTVTFRNTKGLEKYNYTEFDLEIHSFRSFTKDVEEKKFGLEKNCFAKCNWSGWSYSQLDKKGKEKETESILNLCEIYLKANLEKLEIFRNIEDYREYINNFLQDYKNTIIPLERKEEEIRKEIDEIAKQIKENRKNELMEEMVKEFQVGKEFFTITKIPLTKKYFYDYFKIIEITKKGNYKIEPGIKSITDKSVVDTRYTEAAKSFNKEKCFYIYSQMINPIFKSEYINDDYNKRVYFKANKNLITFKDGNIAEDLWKEITEEEYKKRYEN